MRRALPLLLLLAVSGAPGARLRADEPAAPVPLTPEQQRLAQIQAHMQLSDAECAWRKVGWLPSFGDAVAQARDAGRPVFLWAMNGHPLACV